MEEGDDVGDCALVEEFDAFGGLVCDMGSEDDLVAGEDWVVWRDGFLIEDVQGRAGKIAVMEGLDEGVGVDEFAASGVDEDGVGLHHSEFSPSDDAAAVWAEANVDADDVGFLEELVEGDELNAELLGALGGWIERPCDATHAERVCDARDFTSDVACADDAQGLALEGEVLNECPPSCFEFGGLERRAFGGGEHEADDVFGNDGGRASGLIADDDAEFFGGADVDHVDSDGAGCDHTEVWECAECVCRPFDCPAGVDDDMRAACTFELLVHACRPVEVEGNVPVGLEAVEMRGTLDLRRLVAGHDEFQSVVGHCGSLQFLSRIAAASPYGALSARACSTSGQSEERPCP